MHTFKRGLSLAAAALLLLSAWGCTPKDTAETTSTAQPKPAPTEAVTPTPSPTPTPVPTPEHFTLTFAGDCTLGGAEASYNIGLSFINTVKDNYTYPFENVIDYFANDDFSMVNLEGVLADQSTAVVKKHVFRGPTHLVNILTQNSVEAVTIANNHTMDHGQAGYDSTIATLTEAGVTYAEQDGSFIYTTESGLTLGVYAISLDNMNVDQITAAIAALDADPKVDIVILAAHWGIENTFKPNEQQKTIGHAAIDAGADIVFGTHPHVLQPIEEYNGGVIYYSLGNFSFGGNCAPGDYDTALIQQEILLDADGNVTLGQRNVVPCSVSSVSTTNNFQPTPYEAGSREYDRAMSKLNGTFTGPNLPIA